MSTLHFSSFINLGRGSKKIISGLSSFRKSKEDEKIISEYTKDTKKKLEDIEKLTKHLANKDREYEVAVSKSSEDLQVAEKRIKIDMSDKEEYCRAVVSDQKYLEETVLKLNEEMQAIFAEFQAASKAWDLEKNELLSQIVAARKESEEMLIQNKRVLLQYKTEKVELESGLNESKASCQELLEKMVENRHQWDSEKGNLENNVAERQRKLETMATERRLLSLQNRELSTEVESLKVQLKVSNATAAQLKDQLSSLAAAKMFLQKENNSLRTEMEKITFVSEEKQENLQRKVAELETGLYSVKKDLDTSTATIMEKERNVVDLQYKLSEIAETKKFLEEKNRASLSDVNKRTRVLEEKNASLQLKIKELETSLRSLNEDLESKDVQRQDLSSRRPLFPAKSQRKPTPQSQKWKSYLVKSVTRFILLIVNPNLQ